MFGHCMEWLSLSYNVLYEIIRSVFRKYGYSTPAPIVTNNIQKSLSEYYALCIRSNIISFQFQLIKFEGTNRMVSTNNKKKPPINNKSGFINK